MENKNKNKQKIQKLEANKQTNKTNQHFTLETFLLPFYGPRVCDVKCGLNPWFVPV